MNSRRKAWKLGVYAEYICLAYLFFCGYRFLEKRYKTKVGEIDLVMRKSGVIVFIEVKARKTYEEGLYAISPRQLQRIQHTAEIFLSKMRKKQFKGARFDVMVVVPWRMPYHLKNAWQIN